MQVIVVPHVPSVEMAWEAVEVEDVFEEVVFDVLEVVLMVEEVDFTVVELEVTFVEVVDFADVVLDDVQFPEAGWQPVPQYLTGSVSISQLEHLSIEKGFHNSFPDDWLERAIVLQVSQKGALCSENTYAEVEPHHPALEQQFPNVEP